MRLITEKNKNEIGKRLSAIYYITVHGFGNGNRTDLESMTKIIEHVYDIAFVVGGERFSNIDIPAYVKRIEEMEERRELMGCELYKVSTGNVDVARYMPLDTALLLVKALMVEYYNEPELEYTIKRERKENDNDDI